MKNISKQQGIALLALIALLATAATAVTVTALNHSSQNIHISRDKITAAALAHAKEALIGYAVTYAEKHSGAVLGYLPCPDTTGTADFVGEGGATGNCGAQDVSVIGRLPWKTLNTPPLRGGDDECLWYAVSGTYKNNPKTGLMNWDTNGQLQVYSSNGTTLLTPADNQAVAVIFAPGSTLPGQNRSGATAPICGGNYTASNYLDTTGTANNATVSSTANTNSTFYTGMIRDASGNPLLNDQITFITKQDLWNAIQRRRDFLATLDTMTLKTAECIASFGTHNKIGGLPDLANKSLPWPAQLSPSGSADYSVNTTYNDITDIYSGRAPYRVNTSRSDSGNAITSPYYLLQANGANCPGGWASIYPWWNNWKDHLFYAISQRYRPGSNATIACDNDRCLHVNGSGNYAAVVIFANQKLSGQTRASSVTSPQRGIASNFLEGRNASHVANSSSNGNENYQSDTASTTFNDIVYCIKEDLSLVKGTAAGCP